jgi:hypothetical protein
MILRWCGERPQKKVLATLAARAMAASTGDGADQQQVKFLAIVGCI